MTKERSNIEAIYPLSPMQQGMLFHSVFSPNAGVYNQQSVCTLRGHLDQEAFCRAWQEVVNRHAMYRTLFVWERGDQPLQIVQRSAVLPWTQEDWSDLDEDTQASRLEQILQAERERDFDLHAPPLLRCALLRMAPDRYRFVWTQHHVLMDGWCASLVLKDVLACYQAFSEGRVPSLEGSRPYQDYIRWLQQQDSAEAEHYWRDALQGVDCATTLGVERVSRHAASEAQAYQEHRLQLPPELTSRLERFARDQRLTLNVLAQGAWALLLSRYSGDDQVLFGATVSGRPPTLEGVETMVGLFINSLPVRVRVPGDTALLPWLQSLQGEQLERTEYAYTPLVDIHRASEVPAGQPLFESLLVFENYPFDQTLEHGAGALRVSDVRSFERTNYPLTVVLVPGGELSVIFSYDTACFDCSTVARLGDHFRNLLQAMLDKPAATLTELDLLDGDEARRIVVEWNATQRDFAAQACAHHGFEAQAQRSPDALALVFEDEALTYQTLNQRANRLAHYLASLGIGPGSRIGICLRRSPEVVISVLAVLKAGAAYVPLDPAYPAERLAYMLDDADVAVLLSHTELAPQLPATAARVVCLDAERDRIARHPTGNPRAAVEPGDLAYIIYTSGSTGRPKGVLIAHRGLGNLAAAQGDAFGVEPRSCVVQFASMSFDASVSEIFMALTAGARLCLGSAEALLPGPTLTSLLNRYGVTHATLPPSALRLLAPQDLPELQVVIVAGEPCPQDLAATWSRSHRFFNAYGPTEATVCATLAEYLDDGLAPPIGRPLANTTAYILDQRLRPVPVGVPGELHVGGIGLALGYQGRHDLTAQKFIPHPFSDEPEARLYKTGDVARFRADGSIDFLGRRDHQVKLRGFRIEPGEIEQVLGQHPEIEQAVVVPAQNDRGEEDALVACYTRKPQLELWPSIAEFYVYDDIVYRSMATHETRNQRYRNAFQVLEGKTVVEVGPGPEAILSRLALQAGARKVYAVELLEATYRAACKKVAELGLDNRITVIHGDATRIELPEKVDYCISEIVGSIGGSEGAAKIINEVRHLLRDPRHMLPQRTVTQIAGISLPLQEIDYRFPELAASYVRKIFDQVGGPFDLRMCLKNLPPERVISSADVLEELDHTKETPLECVHPITLTFDKAERCTGLLAWLSLHVDEMNVLDTLEDQGSWLPVYFPVFDEGVEVEPGDTLRATVSRHLCENGLNPDYVIEGRINRRSRESVPFRYQAKHVSRRYRGSPFYATLFAGDDIPVRPPLTGAALRAELTRQLPQFMIPSAFRELEAVPLTPNGKVDRAALAADRWHRRAAEVVPPRDEIEHQLVEVWESVLEARPIGVRDDFFDRGGHSLRAIRLMVAIEKRFGRDLPLASVFQHPTIEQLAALLRDGDEASWSPLVPIQPEGTEPPFFCVPGNGGNVVYFNALARCLGRDRPFYGLQSKGLDGVSEPLARIADMAAHYVEALDATKYREPYLLGGHSFGAWVAFEMAQQLLRRGDQVARVFVLDTPAPAALAGQSPESLDDATLMVMAAGVVERMYRVTLGITIETLAGLDGEGQIELFERRLREADVFPGGLRTSQVRGLLRVFKANSQATYQPRDTLPVGLTLIRAAETHPEDGSTDWSGLADSPSWLWEAHCGDDVDVHIVPGDHISMLAEPHVEELARQLKRGFAALSPACRNRVGGLT